MCWQFLNLQFPTQDFYRAHLHIQLLTSYLLDVSHLRHVKLGLVTRPQPSMFSYCSSSLQMLKPETQKSPLTSPPPMTVKSVTRFYASKYLSSLPSSLELHWCCPSSSPNHLATAVTSKPVSLCPCLLCSKSFLHMAATFFQDANLMSFLLLQFSIASCCTYDKDRNSWHSSAGLIGSGFCLLLSFTLCGRILQKGGSPIPGSTLKDPNRCKRQSLEFLVLFFTLSL